MQDDAAIAQVVKVSGDNVTVRLGVDKDDDALVVRLLQLVLQQPQLVIVLAHDDRLHRTQNNVSS